jgi:lipopolysaccharide/colanic/teichoic acid biosynthesis glycosyltransferase
LYSQQDLIDVRTAVGIEKLKPGLTGWARINARDGIPLKIKFALEEVKANEVSLDINFMDLMLEKIKETINSGQVTAFHLLFIGYDIGYKSPKQM